MNLFRKRNASIPAEPGERHCRGCGSDLAEDQLACLECGAVDATPTGRDRRWLLPTGGVIGVALFLVTSASFAATTALNTGDPEAIKPKPPIQVAQAPLPPANGDGAVPESSQDDDSEKGPDLGDLPSGGGGGGGGDAAPPADEGASSGAPADDGADSGNSGGSNSGGSNPGGSNNSGGSNSNGGGTDTKPEPPPPVKVAEWPDGAEGYTVIVYKFNAKSDAKQKAQEVAAKGLPAGILQSDKYASLTPGSWLVYIGEFDSQKQAEKAAAKYENAGYPGEVTFVGQSETPESDPSADGASTTPQQPQP
jgi:cell division septation protein DedD